MHVPRLDPQHGAEASRVGVTQGHARIEFDIHMLVLLRRGTHGHQAQAARHPKVADQAAPADVHQQVFGPAPDLAESLIFYLNRQVLGNRPAQTPLTHHQPGNGAALEMRRYTAAGGFYFR